MSSTQSSSIPSTSKLRQFRLQKKLASASAVPEQNVSNILKTPIIDIQNQNQCLAPISAGKDQGVYLVPDTPETGADEGSLPADNSVETEEKNGVYRKGPESFLQVIFNDGSQSGNAKSVKKEPSTLSHTLNSQKHKEIDNNTENKTTFPAKRKYDNSVIYHDVLKERERSLKQIMDTFPHADIMKMQDILFFADWDVEQAIAFVQENPPAVPTPKTDDISTTNNNKKSESDENVATKQVLSSQSEEICADGWLARPNRVTLKTYSKNVAERKIVLPETKPLIFYGTKERAKVKIQVEKFLTKQNTKKETGDEESEAEVIDLKNQPDDEDSQ